MVGSPPVPLHRLLAPVASLLRLPPPVSLTPPPGLPALSRTETLARYRRLRQISTAQHEAVLDIIAPDILRDRAKRLDVTDGKAVALENSNEMTPPEDLAIYLPRPGRSHPLDRDARLTRFAPGSDQAIVLAAMRRARFALWRVERQHPATGLILRDLPRERESWLVDETMAKTARPGPEVAAPLLQPETCAMIARIIGPVLPDWMTRPALMDEVFTRAPALQRLQGDVLAVSVAATAHCSTRPNCDGLSS